MYMWLAIFAFTVIAGLLGFIYIVSRVRKFEFVNKLSCGNNKLRTFVAFMLVVIAGAIIYFTLGYVNMSVIFIYLFVFWVLCELVFTLIRKITKKEALLTDKIYYAGVAALVITTLFLAKGWYNDRVVRVTEYKVVTDKPVKPLRIVQITDSHLGTTFDGEGFTKQLSRVNGLNADIVVFTGDYVDGSTKDEDIISATKGFSQVQSKYGTYFIFGNHDKNIYGEEGKRKTKADDLARMLEENNVHVLEDDVVKITDGYTVIGRKDLTDVNRDGIGTLMCKVDEGDFTIDLNHQPNDFRNEEAAGVDLVLSGHTHGGQFWPIQNAGIWMGANDMIYGYEKIGNTNFIVSSGISDWALDFKTGCFSEIVVIDIVSSND